MRIYIYISTYLYIYRYISYIIRIQIQMYMYIYIYTDYILYVHMRLCYRVIKQSVRIQIYKLLSLSLIYIYVHRVIYVAHIPINTCHVLKFVPEGRKGMLRNTWNDNRANKCWPIMGFF